jgi:DNA-binding LytR/AlgR family response regulator
MLKPLFVWQNKELKRIDAEEVICLSTEGNYTKIYLADNTFYMVRSSLSTMLKKLPPDIFIKTHRSYVASVYHISTICKDHLVVMDQPIPIAKQHYRSLLAKLNIINEIE